MTKLLLENYPSISRSSKHILFPGFYLVVRGGQRSSAVNHAVNRSPNPIFAQNILSVVALCDKYLAK